ncbi:MAG: DUF885 domain-containing protein [Myxococcaceae bacterium]|nr:DUF885 domain-containing protein [Myxococcaceae bacterium]MCI0672227.1 DUF885 domain-containing protein [Myxococcaceae bacterium]
MTRLTVLAAAVLVTACATVPQATAPTADLPDRKAAESRKLHALFEDYFEARLELNPVEATSIGDDRYNDRFSVTIAPDHRAKVERLERGALAKVSDIDVSLLEGQDRLSYDIFKLGRERAIEGMRFPGWLLPFNQFYSTPNSFVQMGSGNGLHPFKKVKDYDDWLKRVDGLVAWTEQAITNMREGMAKGYVQPKVLMEKTLPQLSTHVVQKPEDSLFWGPVKAFPADFSDADKARLTAAFRTAIEQKLVPSYKRLHAFVRDEYLPKCRDTVGLDALPDGAAWYAHNLRQITTTDLTPAQIHQIGLDEVQRIHAEMAKVMREVGFKGDLQAFFKHVKADPKFFWASREELVQGYGTIKRRVDANLTRLFEGLPKADYEVRAVEPFREKSAAGGQYQAANEDGSRPGIFYANAYELKSRPKWAMESLSLHEGNPGHHFQITLARENKDLPRFRRFGGYTAYSEGWGLYAESLGKELGMYEDPYQYFGMLEAELWRAVRLVVDTGLHSKGWSREQVLAYMSANTAAGEAQKVSEAERYIAIPGQATAYKVGQLKIRELRTRAERALGAGFDVRAFHSQVLGDGPLPLDVLEAKLERWMAPRQAETGT